MNENSEKLKKVFFKNKTLPNLLTKYPSFFLFNKLPYSLTSLKYNQTEDSNLLYIHIPFCFSICNFCNLYKTGFQSSTDTGLYLDVLVKELEEIAHKTKGKVSCIWIGGGTPNLLTDKQTDRLFESIFSFFNVEKKYHLELDVHPAFIKKSTLDIYHKYKVNLLSFGIQSFNTDVLKMANRGIQNKVPLMKKLAILGDYNFDLHFDFIVGLPNDDMEVDHSLIDDMFTLLKIHSVSVNKYENSFNTNYFKKGFRVTVDENIAKRKAVGDLEKYIFTKYGVERVSSPFIKKFFFNRFNVIGAGAGAFGYLRGEGVYRNPLLEEYMNISREKKLFSFDGKDERIMYILHNWQRKDFSFSYKSQFNTYILNDFPDFFTKLDEKFYKKIDDTDMCFNFPSHEYAEVLLAGLYLDKVYKYYE